MSEQGDPILLPECLDVLFISFNSSFILSLLKNSLFTWATDKFYTKSSTILVRRAQKFNVQRSQSLICQYFMKKQKNNNFSQVIIHESIKQNGFLKIFDGRSGFKSECQVLQKFYENLTNQEVKYIITFDMQNAVVEVIKNRLYFMISDKAPKDIPKAFYFNIDNDLQYDAFYEDFGPLNLSKVWKYTSEVQKIMKDEKFKDNIFYHQTSTQFKKNTNAAFLICAAQMILHNKTADESWKPFSKLEFVPFRDASYGACTYQCTILDCLRGLQYAMKLGWFDFKKFNVTEYDHFEKVENGDLNWIVPNKFVAFSSPSGKKKDQQGIIYFTPKDYVPIFKRLGVSSVVRLNTVTYNKDDFVENGIKHFDLYFTDGTSPPKEIVQKFLQITEAEEDAFAVHCKAGLGRTGSLIGCYAMKHYFFNAADFIGWIRICRPGSILGPQQHFMIQIQKQMKAVGKTSLIWKQISQKFQQKQVEDQMKKLSIKSQKMSESEKKIDELGDKGQGDRLVNRKKQSVRS